MCEFPLLPCCLVLQFQLTLYLSSRSDHDRNLVSKANQLISTTMNSAKMTVGNDINVTHFVFSRKKHKERTNKVLTRLWQRHLDDPRQPKSTSARYSC